jgi:hypothetical protein
MYVNVNVKKMFHFIHVLCCHRTSDQSKGLVYRATTSVGRGIEREPIFYVLLFDVYRVLPVPPLVYVPYQVTRYY